MTALAFGLAPARHAGVPAAWGRAAINALYDELALYPKPGLVSFVDTGSHDDMDAGTFLRSLFALRHYFARIAQLGHDGAGFAALQAAGMEAEQRMLMATRGVNTHRGAIFCLGLLCAAAGALQRTGMTPCAAGLRDALALHWGGALSDRSRALPPSHGMAAVQRHRVRGANEEAAAGMPVLFEVALPALRRRLAEGHGWREARLEALFQVMAVLDDTNLVHRGGLAGLRDAQAAASEFIAAGGVARADALAHAEGLHRAFVARRLSPGGAADVLAAACFVHRVTLA
jgi:triphosphoribosyl-dephospho-CoA synthase